MRAGEYGAFTELAQKLAAELHNVVLSDQVRPRSLAQHLTLAG